MTTFQTSSQLTETSVAEQADTDAVLLPPRIEEHDPVDPKVTLRRRLACVSSVVVAILLLAIGVASLSRKSVPVEQRLIYFDAQLRNLPISITERGTLESQQDVKVECEVDDIHGDGIYGTVILWLIENGTPVKKGDLLAELDTASHIDRLDGHIVETIHARGQYTARKLDYEARLTANKIRKANAELAVELADLKLKQYQDENGGTYQISLQDVDLAIRQREARQRIVDRNFSGTERLHELGYKSKGDLAQVRLETLHARNATRRETARRIELAGFKHTRSRMQLEGTLRKAERKLSQVERENEAKRLQSEIWMRWAELGKTWKEMYLEKYETQLEKCKIFAPASGIVVYHVETHHWGQSSTIKEGDAVRNGQPLLSIPDLEQMQVQIAIHETVIDHVSAGMPATVRLDAFSGREYRGTVKSIDLLPDPGGWLGSGTKQFRAIVTIDEEVDEVKPGMTAVVDIHLAELTNVVCVPIQSIVHRGHKYWCYVNRDGLIEKTPIKIGMMDSSFVEVVSGISAGDQVALDPTPILAIDPDQQHGITPDNEELDEFSFE